MPIACRMTKYLFLFLIICSTAYLFPDDPPEPIITEIKFEGLEKTKESYIQDILKRFTGIPEKSLDLHEVETVLEELQLFSEIKLSVEQGEDGSVFLFIRVKEKFFFLPIPFFMYSSDNGFMGGAFVMDTNAFGIRDNYLVGGIFSKNIQLAFMSYSRPSRDAAHPGFSVSASFIHRDREERNSKNRRVIEYDTMGGSANVSVSDKISRHSEIEAGLGYDYTNIDAGKSCLGYEKKLKSFHSFSLNGGWKASFPELNEWFMSSKSLSAGGEISFLTTGKTAESVNIRISIQKPLPITRLRAIMQYSGYFSHNVPLAFLPSQTVVGTTIMPEKFHSAKMAGINTGLEVGILKIKYVVFSAYALLEQFTGEDFDSSLVMDFGYSTGIKMYLKTFAFPAIALGVSHNIMENDLKFSVAIGVGEF